MRIAKLDLVAYGPFRGVELDLSAPGVHVVFGRNEAGKSTTLRAIGGLLYGIDVRTKDAHVHKAGDLRIGGTLVSADGARVRIVRRKGASNTLLDDAGQPMDDGALLRMLAGVSEETWKTAFGLDLGTLHRGGLALLEGKGDVGGSLFDASVGGGADAVRLLAALNEEADGLYKPRASTSALVMAMKAHEAAVKATKDKLFLPEAYAIQEDELARTRAERDEKTAKKTELAIRRAQLGRLKNRLPRDRRKKELLAVLAGMGPLAKHGPRVATLQTRLGAYERADKERRSLAVEADLARGQVAEAARRAGVSVDPSGAVAFEERTVKRIQTLVSEVTKLAGGLERARQEIERDERELARLSTPTTSTNTATGAGNDEALATLKRALERARSLGDVAARTAAEAAKVAKRSAEVDKQIAALRAFVRPVAELVALELPVTETIERLAARAHDLERTLERLAERDRDAESKERALETQIAEASGDFAPPDKSALSAARRARDAALVAVREARAAASVDARAVVNAEAELERTLREADAVADRMIAEADRVTALARFRAEHASWGKMRAEWRLERDGATAARAALDVEHTKLWASARIEPLGFAEMLAWLERHAQVVEAHARLVEATIDADHLAAAASAARAELALALAGADVAPPKDARGELAPIEDLVLAGAAKIARVEEARRSASEALRAAEKIAVQLEERRASSVRDEATLAQSLAKLRELAAPLGLPGDATGEEVLHALDARKEVFALEEKRAALAARAAIAEADARTFEEDAAKCAADLASDLAGLSALEIVSTLVARSKAAHAAEQELASVDKELADLGDEAVPEELLDAASDASALERLLEDTEAAWAEVDEDVTRLAKRLGTIEAGMKIMYSESGAAEAALVAQEALARVRALAERYARTKAAAVILAREIERYREQHQGPLLGTASKLFARLTLGGFTGVRAGFDEKDRPALRCVRAGNVEVEIGGLSEGTRDQLHLALRLASLLRHAETAEPMPLVLDDILIQFDDDRSRAALAIIAEIAERMQVLFFTHHARVVDLAREAIPALTVHDLGRVTEKSLSASPA